MPSSRAWSLAAPSTLPLVFALWPGLAQASRVVYINTEPVTVTAGATNDPSTDTINVNGFTTTEMDGWTGAAPEQIEELLDLLKQTTLPLRRDLHARAPSRGPLRHDRVRQLRRSLERIRRLVLGPSRAVRLQR